MKYNQKVIGWYRYKEESSNIIWQTTILGIIDTIIGIKINVTNPTGGRYVKILYTRDLYRDLTDKKNIIERYIPMWLLPNLESLLMKNDI